MAKDTLDMSDKKDRDYFARHVGVCDPDDILRCVPELVDLVNSLTRHNRINEISDLKDKNKELLEVLTSARFTIEYAEDEHTKIQMLKVIDSLIAKYKV
jgi:DNA-directed RNA polymerase subunit F